MKKLFMFIVISFGLFLSLTCAASASQMNYVKDVAVDNTVLYWNTAGWDRSKLITYGNYQYTAYWDSDYKLVLARRNLTNDEIQTVKFNDELPDTYYDVGLTQRDNNHRNTAIGISPSNGRLHISFNHHADINKYKVSSENFITNPPATISASDFGATINILGDLDEITYPRFFNDKNDKLYFAFRNGWCAGDADHYLFKYDSISNTWSPVAGTGMVISRGVTPPDPEVNYSAYEHDYIFDSTGSADAPGRLHVTWTWRDIYNERQWDTGLNYMYSDDGGVTWYNNAGTKIADLNASDPVQIDDPGLVAVSAPQGSWIINNGGLVLDSNNQPHVFTARSTILTVNEYETNMHNIHYWRNNATGTWNSQYMEDTTEPICSWRTRGDIAMDSNDDIYAYSLYKGVLYIFQALASENWGNWRMYAISEAFMSGDGMKYDTYRWKESGVLSIPILDKSGSGGTKYVIKEYQIGTAAIPPVPKQLLPLREAGKIIVRWDVTQRADRYDVYRRMSSESVFTKIATVNTKSLRSNYTDTAINDAQIYYYKIKSINEAGESQFSDYEPVVAPLNANNPLKVYLRMDEPFEEVAEDYSGNGNDGMPVNSPGWKTGIMGYAIEFSGKNYLEINDSSTLDGMSTLTVSAWVNISQLPSAGQEYVVIGKDSSSSQASYRLTVNASGTGHFVVNTGGNFYSPGTRANYTTVLSTGTWYHITGTYDGTTVKVYVNGILEGMGSQNISGNIFNGTSKLRIGESASEVSGLVPLKGKIDETRIYSKALDPVEITELYKAAVSGSDNLKGLWKMDEWDGVSVFDSSPSGINSGIVLGGATRVKGQKGRCIRLDGINDYVEIPDNSSLDGMDTLTVSVLFKLEQLPQASTTYVIAGKDKTQDSASYRLAVNSSGTGHFVVSTEDNIWYTEGTEADFTTPLSPGSWYQLVGTYDGTTVKVYVNGVLRGTGTQPISGHIINGSSPVILGDSAASATDLVPVNGYIDETRIYNKALTPAEISALYSTAMSETDTLKAHWKMDEPSGCSVADSSACGLNGGITYYGAGRAAGVDGNCINLDGTNDYVEMPDSSTLNGMSSLTVSAWVNLDQLPQSPQYYVIVGKDETGSEASYRLAVNSSGTGHFVVSTENNYWYSAGTKANFTTALSPGTWYHIVGTYDGTTVKVYVNGVLRGTGTSPISGNIINGACRLRIGYKPEGDFAYLDGKVDDVRVYSRALNATEVQNLYQSY